MSGLRIIDTEDRGMDRAYVTCHMAISLDGKIDGDFHESPQSEGAGKYYYDVIFNLGSSMAGGRVTTQMYSKQPEIDYTKYNGESVPDGDYIIKEPNNHYCLIYDREGKCNWDTSESSMNDVSMQIVEVVSQKVRKEYLTHLRKIGISYIFAETVRESLKKLKTIYGVEKLVLTGGAAINGGFLGEDMIDALSIVVLPYVDGDSGHKALMDTEGRYFENSFAFSEAKSLPDGAVHMIFKRNREADL